MPIRLAVIDGHTLTRYGLRELVARHSDIEIVAECQSAADAPQMIARVRPEVVTVEVSLPDGDGLQLAREFRDRYADLGIVVLTAQHEDDVLFRALETGVSAFVAKTAPLDEMLAAIRHAAVAASSFTASGLAVALARRRSVQDRLLLSPREAEVLGLLRDGLSIPAIATAMFISQSTAKTYVARLYDKLGAANRAQALMTAMHYGLIHYQHDAPFPVPLPRRAGRLAPAGALTQRSPLIHSASAQQRDDREGLSGGSRPGARKAVRPLHRPGDASAVAVLTRGLLPGSRSLTPTAVPRAALRQVPRAGRPMVPGCRYPSVRIPPVARCWAALPGREQHCPHRVRSPGHGRWQDRCPHLARP
jgi:DNA-binding NarL/FixJ family response regulator